MSGGVGAPAGRERVHVRIHGRVQGVGYRAFARREAVQRGLTGWVANCDDGSVELEAEGPSGLLDDLLTVLARGPRLALVERVEPLARLGVEGAGFAGFEIRGW